MCSPSKTTKKSSPTSSRPSTGTPFPPQACTHDKAHGRIEQRSIRTTTALNDYLAFPHLGQACLIERHVTDIKTGQLRSEHAYCLTDLSPQQASPEQLLAYNRGHWAIENRLHWVRDVTFDEDRCQARKGYGPQVLASLRNLVISLLRRLIRGTQISIASALRYFAARPCKAVALFTG